MIQKVIKVEVNAGMEDRPVPTCVQIASQFESSIHIAIGSKKVNAKSLLGMMTIGFNAGDEIEVMAEGADEAQAIAELEKYLTAK